MQLLPDTRYKQNDKRCNPYKKRYAYLDSQIADLSSQRIDHYVAVRDDGLMMPGLRNILPGEQPANGSRQSSTAS